MMKFKLIAINKMYKRCINTQELQSLMLKIIENKTLQKTTKSISKDEFYNKMINLKEKVNLTTNTQKYETIEENLKESREILNDLSEIFRNIKRKTVKIDIEIKQGDILEAENKLDTLNTSLKNARDINLDNNILLENTQEIMIEVEKYEKIVSNSKKSIWDISWLNPFIDFYNNNSRLVLTIGAGLVIGGTWYLNNVGIINIGSLLTRLGINLWGTSTQPQPNITIINQQPSQSNSNSERAVTTGFFREVGKRLLTLIDIFIEKLKEGKTKYK